MFAQTNKPNLSAYEQWAFQQEPSAVECRRIGADISRWDKLPSVHLALFVAEPQLPYLARTIAALQAQLYGHWRLHILSFDAATADVEAETRITWQQLGDDDDSLEALNAVLLASNADWVAVLHAGDLLSVDALYHMARTGNADENLGWIYCDHDHLAEDYSRLAPAMKMAYNAEWLRSHHYTDGLSFYRQSVFAKLGGFDPTVEGAHLYDFDLRAGDLLGRSRILHLPKIQHHRHPAGFIFDLPVEESWTAHQLVIERHLAGKHWPAQVTRGPIPGSFHIRYFAPTSPEVTIVIPTRNHLIDLARCIDSVMRFTDYSNYRLLIVDNQSDDAETLAYMTNLAARGEATVIRYDAPFNFSAICNLAVEHVTSPYVLFLNNDTVALHPEWLSVLVGQAEVTGAGAVGPLLTAQGGRHIQHAGVVLGLGNLGAEHVFQGQLRGGDAHVKRSGLSHHVEATTGACLLVRRADYLAVGGMDELAFPTQLQDVDLCLKLADRLGRDIAYTPLAQLTHYANKTVGEVVAVVASDATAGEQLLRMNNVQHMEFLARWRSRIVADRTWNAQYARTVKVPTMEHDKLLNRLPGYRPVPIVMAWPDQNSAAAQQRFQQLSGDVQAEDGYDLIAVRKASYGFVERLVAAPDHIWVQNLCAPGVLTELQSLRTVCGSAIVWDIDHAPNWDNFAVRATSLGMDEAAFATWRDTMFELADRIVVSNPADHAALTAAGHPSVYLPTQSEANSHPVARDTVDQRRTDTPPNYLDVLETVRRPLDASGESIRSYATTVLGSLQYDRSALAAFGRRAIPRKDDGAE